MRHEIEHSDKHLFALLVTREGKYMPVEDHGEIVSNLSKAEVISCHRAEQHAMPIMDCLNAKDATSRLLSAYNFDGAS